MSALAQFPVLSCLDDPLPSDGTCASAVWVEQPSMLPPLSISDAQEIGWALLSALAAVMVVKIVAKKTQ